VAVSETVEEAVKQMLIRGTRFPEIEAFLERQPLAEEHKSALWLWAWVEQSWGERHRSALPRERMPAGG
jgi:hypothetical protein